MSDIWKERETPLFILRDEPYPFDALNVASLISAGMSEPLTCRHRRRTDLTYIDTPKPLSKRRARRLRGRGQI